MVTIADSTNLPDTMRAVLLTGLGGPEMLDLRDDVPVPMPGPGEALMRVVACGVNNTDINTRVGWYSKAVTGATSGDGYTEAESGDSAWGGTGLAFPRIQGADASGVIVAVGEGVDPAMLGRRAISDPCLRDTDNPADRTLAGYLGSERDGGFAEYCTLPIANVGLHSSTLTDVEMASFPCSWSTAEHMLQRIDLRSGQTIAVTGASGGVGSALVSLAKLRDARVVAIAGASKLEAVGALGADVVIARDTEDVPVAVHDAVDGNLDAVADVVGGTDFVGWLEHLNRGGRYVTAGAIAGPMVDLDLRTLYLNDLELYGATVYQSSVFTDLLGYIERGEVRPAVGPTFPLEEIAAAQEAFQAKQHVGAVVITIDDSTNG